MSRVRDLSEFFEHLPVPLYRSAPDGALLAGNAATEAILGETGITKLRGKWYEWNGRWVMPIFHPSYLLRNPTRDPGSPKALIGRSKWRPVSEWVKLGVTPATGGKTEAPRTPRRRCGCGSWLRSGRPGGSAHSL